MFEQLKRDLPELPAARRERFAKEYTLGAYDVEVLTANPRMADYYESVARAHGDPKASANWVMGDLAGLLKAEAKEIEESPVSAENLGLLVALIAQGKISGKLAPEIFPKMFATGKAPDVIMAEENLTQISDEGALAKIIDKVIAANPKQLEQYRSGKTTVLNFFLGQAMKASRGQADPATVNRMLKEKL